MNIYRGETLIYSFFINESSSFSLEEEMGEHTLTINFLSINVLYIEINDTTVISGEKYKIRHNEDVTKKETSLGYEYTIKMYSTKYDLEDVSFFLAGTPERKKNHDYYTGKASDWLALFVANMNRNGSGWTAGSCVESKYITISFKDKNVGQVLDELVKSISSDTEYWISNKEINIGKLQIANDGLTLGQGEGMGFTELKIDAVDDTPPVTVLYPYGSDKNLGSDYGNDYLVLPGGALSIQKNVDKYGVVELSKQYDDIFPHGEFLVTSKIDNYTLQASGIDFNLTDCLIDGTDVIVTFQDGELSGYDLNIDSKSWDNDLKQFTLQENTEENALKVPGDINFAVGDKFIITGIKMPQSYITSAENELSTKSQADLDTMCEKKVQLSGKCDDILFKRQSITVQCGQMVHVYSYPLNIDRDIRVTKVKRYLEKDGTPSYRYELTLSDFLQSQGFKNLITDVTNIPETINSHVSKVTSFTKRRWQDAKETTDLLSNALSSLSDTYTSAINPITVKTMQVLLGDESLQFRFVDNKTNPIRVEHIITYNKNTKVLNIPGGIIQHMTLGIKNVSAAHNVSEYKFWDVSELNYTVSGTDPYYLYVKCSKTTATAEFIMSTTAIGIDDVSGYYHLWVGILNSEYDNDRSYVDLYGFTEILPGRITVDKIVSTDGLGFFDFVSGAARIGNASRYISSDPVNGVKIKSVIVQNDGGVESVIGCDRGVYNSSYPYYVGDTVTYVLNGGTSTYKNKVACTGIVPTNTDYWTLVASQGTDGSYFEYRFAKNGSKTTAPSLVNTDAAPLGWTTSQPVPGTLEYLWMIVAKKTALGALLTNWSTPVRASGADGADGSPGPAPVFRGTYSSTTTYYGNSIRVDVVRDSNGVPWIASRTAPNGTSGFSGQAPSASSSYWNSFGASFDSIATGLLLAEWANLAGFIFQNNIMYSQDVNHTTEDANFSVNGATGEVQCKNIHIKGGDVDLYNDGTHFVKIGSVVGGGGYIKARADSATVAAFTTYGANASAIALSLLSNSSGYGKALEAFGNSELNARAGESSLIKGLRLNARSLGASYSGTVNAQTNDDYIENTSGNSISLVLPYPYNVPGKFMFIRNTSGTLTISGGTILYGGNTVSSVSIANGDTKLRLFISTDASRWIYQTIGD